MNEYFKVLQQVNQSTTQLLAGEYHGLVSLEIQNAARSLQKSVQPCLDELKESALRLKQLVNTSLETLDHSEDVWQSKQRIAEASQFVIWEQVADLTATHCRIKKKIREGKTIILEEVENLLKEMIAECKKEYFTDKNGKLIDSIGWGNKDNFSKDIQEKVKNFSGEVDKKLLELLDQNIHQMELVRFIEFLKNEDYIVLFDNENAQCYRNKFDYFSKTINEKFCRILNTLGGVFEEQSVIQTIYNQAMPTLISWQKKLIGNISRKEVDDFEKEILKNTQQRVETILDDRLEFAIKTIEESLEFCNTFLELRNKYQQEKPEKKLIEKTWIDDQYKLLSGIQEKIIKIIE
ncbi:MAG: hypothetical protein VKL42_01030 [Snowella sp.]|nr:hypothetical protein [Snowella sp.]